jgi:glycosyltransferase involved in cell wall biosynthesis
MRIAYIGLKGLPGTFSGIETHVHELGSRLARRGHDVVAYVRPQYTPRHVKIDEGIRLLHLPTIARKHLDATVHSFLAALHTIIGEYDIVHFHTIGPGCFAPLARMSGAKVVTTIHRFDYLSGKWGRFARACLRTAEQISLRVPHATIVVAPFLQAHYKEQGHEVTHITNGVTLPHTDIGSSLIEELGLKPERYVLFLGRLTPEKRPDWAIHAFQQINNGTTRLVIAGGSSATDGYVEDLKALARPLGDKILFTGPVYGALKDELLANARAFVLPSALEGLPITLLEAMSHGRPCLASDIPPHQGVIQDSENGLLHRWADREHLRERLAEIIDATPADLARVGAAASITVAKEYNWEKVVDQTERLYRQILTNKSPTRSSTIRSKPERMRPEAVRSSKT